MEPMKSKRRSQVASGKSSTGAEEENRNDIFTWPFPAYKGKI